MGINLHSYIGVIIKCDPKGDKKKIEIPDERLYCIYDESESHTFENNHVYVANRKGYSITTTPDTGKLYKISDYNFLHIIEKFKKNFKPEIERLAKYYGEENILIFVGLYCYYG